MNFTTCMHMATRGHKYIDFVDIHVDGDNKLYIDPERIAMSTHPYATPASEAINDFFDVLCQIAAARDDDALYDLLSFGREPNETHLGLSTLHSCGRGTTPEIMMPIVHDMISSGMFDAGLVTQLSDLHIWTPNFNYDRLSDLTTNIIRSVLVDYTYHQYRIWGLEFRDEDYRRAPAWDFQSHKWAMVTFPNFMSDRYPTLLVPKSFVGRSMLSSPGELLYKHAFLYRQKEHLDERSEYCHLIVKRNGDELLKPPTKKELQNIEVKGRPVKEYLRQIGAIHPNIVHELHAGHHNLTSRKSCFLTDWELDNLLYSPNKIAL